MELSAAVREVGGIFPPARMTVDPPGADWDRAQTDRWRVVVRPRSTDEIARALRVANRQGLPVRIGGGTGPQGTTLLVGGCLVIDMTGMDRVVDLDPESHLVRVQAGISIAVLRSRLAEAGLIMGWDPLNDTPHTLGGVLSGVSTRWGALYQNLRESVRGLTVVLPDGAIFATPTAPRRATGPGMFAIFAGGKGRLGVVVEVALRVFPEPACTQVRAFELPVERLGELARIFVDGVVPHLVEVRAPREGRAQVVVSLQGSQAAVRAGERLVEGLGGADGRSLLSLPSPVSAEGDEGPLLDWSALDAFLAAWQADGAREPFRMDRVTAYRARVLGGGAAAQRAGLAAAFFPVTTADRAAAADRLEAVRAALDPRDLLGSPGPAPRRRGAASAGRVHPRPAEAGGPDPESEA